MKAELIKPGQEVAESEFKTLKTGEADEVAAHSGVAVDVNCPSCGSHLSGFVDRLPHWCVCPDCGARFIVY